MPRKPGRVKCRDCGFPVPVTKLKKGVLCYTCTKNREAINQNKLFSQMMMEWTPTRIAFDNADVTIGTDPGSCRSSVCMGRISKSGRGSGSTIQAHGTG